ncbi:hypothetical protein Ava_3787 [Trichormus variabilis ATCC 29413]|uniref:Uncharacterized protein n=2 Tax=Anabaena variabilis TaxID=264691 RepID=Q3M6J4_TRIV2|nr:MULTISPECIES: hypothetical protein [Nostocaceae]ABA23392.1 hypothetical protein Ava_3787 [Trichormus variabilis ATCC 29413]MBC1215138.1 hypothetical protein [Trichormus variabilis ARAD]MBC1255451.1 hypothetical protein [Trichormus variabilis V5]MBC1268200.1 hypothetical protein [Trichormus variabilis FSR]MBC1303773.1 hypothetical protein [Trichormus variabilis N2B]
MTKRNILNDRGQKSRWPNWLPYPSCWLKSFVLMLFVRVVTFVGENLVRFGYNFAKFISSPELFAIFIILALLSPIAVISFTHHYLHLLLGRFFAEIQAPEVGDVKGLVPTLMSWWEGLYGWVVIALSTLVAALLCTFILPIFNLSYTNPLEIYTQFERQIIVIFGIFWLITGALIYQIDYLVRHRLISVYSSNQKSS